MSRDCGVRSYSSFAIPVGLLSGCSFIWRRMTHDRSVASDGRSWEGRTRERRAASLHPWDYWYSSVDYEAMGNARNVSYNNPLGAEARSNMQMGGYTFLDLSQTWNKQVQRTTSSWPEWPYYRYGTDNCLCPTGDGDKYLFYGHHFSPLRIFIQCIFSFNCWTVYYLLHIHLYSPAFLYN